MLDDLVERLPEQFDMEDIRGRVDEFSPYVMVAIQVCTSISSYLRNRCHSLHTVANLAQHHQHILSSSTSTINKQSFSLLNLAHLAYTQRTVYDGSLSAQSCHLLLMQL